MKEYGSDFHYILASDFFQVRLNQFKDKQFYADGRQAIQHLVVFRKWERIWMPEYFCYEIVNAIKETGVEVVFYPDAPGLNDDDLVKNIPFRKNDVILRMNYFGMRSRRDNSKVPVEVIEDHSHDLIGDWSTKSNADWCIASLRKTLPIPEGGMLWSPKKHEMPVSPLQTDENNKLTSKRWDAMKLKMEYIDKGIGDKETFRRMYIETEEDFEKLPVSDLTSECKEYLRYFDVKRWTNVKNENWRQLSKIKSDGIQILYPENPDCNMFSFVFLLESEQLRNRVKTYLINNNLYPVVLWNLREEITGHASEFSKRMVSIPCDGRYNADDMTVMKEILTQAIVSSEK